MLYTEQLHTIKTGLKKALPGWPAQSRMTPIYTEKYRAPREGCKKAGVAVLLYPENNELYLTYIKRQSHHPDDKHKGQVSFAGGQMEASDIDLKATALREMEEELGVKQSDAQVLGPLSSIYVYISDFYVEPYIVYYNTAPTFNIQPSEVAYVIRISLNMLLTPSTQSLKDISIGQRIIKDVPYYKLEDDVLWGATAMITSELLALF